MKVLFVLIGIPKDELEYCLKIIPLMLGDGLPRYSETDFSTPSAHYFMFCLDHQKKEKLHDLGLHYLISSKKEINPEMYNNRFKVSPGMFAPDDTLIRAN